MPPKGSLGFRQRENGGAPFLLMMSAVTLVHIQLQTGRKISGLIYYIQHCSSNEGCNVAVLPLETILQRKEKMKKY